MHAIFMLYGHDDWVNKYKGILKAQLMTMRLYKEGEEDKHIYMDCQLRVMPFGVYEFVFPKEHADLVLTSLKFHQPSPYDLNKEIEVFKFKIQPLKYLKKFLRIEDAPEFKSDKVFPWSWMPHVSIIPLGVRPDGEITEKAGEHEGWSHEAI